MKASIRPKTRTGSTTIPPPCPLSFQNPLYYIQYIFPGDSCEARAFIVHRVSSRTAQCTVANGVYIPINLVMRYEEYLPCSWEASLRLWRGTACFPARGYHWSRGWASLWVLFVFSPFHHWHRGGCVSWDGRLWHWQGGTPRQSRIPLFWIQRAGLLVETAHGTVFFFSSLGKRRNGRRFRSPLIQGGGGTRPAHMRRFRARVGGRGGTNWYGTAKRI